jgi:hypothetical protein
MAQSQAQRTEAPEDGGQYTKKQPVARAKNGKVEIAIWPNEGSNGTFYTASAPTIRYQDEKGEYLGE